MLLPLEANEGLAERLVAVVAVTALPVQLLEEPETLPVTSPVNEPLNFVAVKVPVEG